MEKKILLKVTLDCVNRDYSCHVEDFDFTPDKTLNEVYRYGGNPYIYVTYTKSDNGDTFDLMMNESRRNTVILKAKIALERAERDRLETLLCSLDMFKAQEIEN